MWARCVVSTAVRTQRVQYTIYLYNIDKYLGWMVRPTVRFCFYPSVLFTHSSLFHAGRLDQIGD